jgi:hypothetical protein
MKNKNVAWKIIILWYLNNKLISKNFNEWFNINIIIFFVAKNIFIIKSLIINEFDLKFEVYMKTKNLLFLIHTLNK